MVGREKHLYSLYRKMREKHLSFAEVLDVYAFRILVDSVDMCYRVLGCLHNLYKPVPGRFKDYIAIPKTNGYQSLHTSLVGIDGLLIEGQIRTADMDLFAESGIAAHWLYKSGQDADSAQLRAREWLRNLLEVLRHGRRRVAVHAEDEERLRERLGLVRGGADVGLHPEWRDPETCRRATERLLGLAGRHDVPLMLAVIPARATEALAQRLAEAGEAVVAVQHGFAHRNHAPTGERKWELGTHRPTDEILDELARGRDPADEAFLEEAGQLAHRRTRPLTNIDGDVDYRREMVPVFVKRAFRSARPRS